MKKCYHHTGRPTLDFKSTEAAWKWCNGGRYPCFNRALFTNAGWSSQDWRRIRGVRVDRNLNHTGINRGCVGSSRLISVHQSDSYRSHHLNRVTTSRRVSNSEGSVLQLIWRTRRRNRILFWFLSHVKLVNSIEQVSTLSVSIRLGC